MKWNESNERRNTTNWIGADCFGPGRGGMGWDKTGWEEMESCLESLAFQRRVHSRLLQMGSLVIRLCFDWSAKENSAYTIYNAPLANICSSTSGVTALTLSAARVAALKTTLDAWVCELPPSRRYVWTPLWKAGGILRVSTRFGLNVENEQAVTRDGTAEPVLRDQILRREQEQGNKKKCPADHEQDWQLYQVDPYSSERADHTWRPFQVIAWY